MKITLILFAILFCSVSANAQHSLQLDNGIGSYSTIIGSTPGGTYILPPGGGFFLTSSLSAGVPWLLGGNGGTIPGTNFLGTTDGQQLQILVKTGSDTNNALILNPNGSIQHSAKGNARGTNSVDLQADRSDAVQVASGINTVITGGLGNKATGFASFVGAGQLNHADRISSAVVSGSYNAALHDNSFVGAGLRDSAKAFGSFIGAGEMNTTIGMDAAIVAGGRNNAEGATSFIGAGFINTVTGFGSSITSGEMNYISAMDAHIGAGSLDTIMANNSAIAAGFRNKTTAFATFVGAGEGNIASSTNASVVGGYYNTSNGFSTFIGGGQGNYADHLSSGVGAGAFNQAIAHNSFIGAGYSDTAHGDFSFIGAGEMNVTDGMDAAIVAGARNYAGGQMSFIGGGFQDSVFGFAGVVTGGELNKASGNWAFIGGGVRNEVSGNYASVVGGSYASASLFGQQAHASGRFASVGDAQTSVYVVRNTTSDAAATELFLNGTSARMIIPSGAVWKFHVLVAGTTATGALAAAYELTGAIKNVGGTTSLIGVVAQTSVLEDAGAAAWNATAVADNANDALIIQVTGAAATNIRWVARVETTEVSF